MGDTTYIYFKVLMLLLASSKKDYLYTDILNTTTMKLGKHLL